jgi:SAM-dependent methyltransferase
MSHQQTAEIFTRAAPGFDKVGPQFFRHSGRRLVEWMHIRGGAKVLDVATGRGAVLFAVARQLAPDGQAIGVDLSAGMIREIGTDVRRATSKDIQIGQMDAEQLAFASEAFDYVLCGHSIIFFPPALNEFHRVLRSNGQVGVTIIAQGCFDWLLAAFPIDESSPDEPGQQDGADQNSLALDTPDGLAEGLCQAGFTGIQIVETVNDLVYADEDAWWQMLWTLGFRGTLEAMDSTALQAFQGRLFRELQAFRQPDGIHILFRELFAMGLKP